MILGILTFNLSTLSITTFIITIKNAALSIRTFNAYAEFHNAYGSNSVQYAERRYAECHYAECHYVECRYAERRGTVRKSGGKIEAIFL